MGLKIGYLLIKWAFYGKTYDCHWLTIRFMGPLEITLFSNKPVWIISTVNPICSCPLFRGYYIIDGIWMEPPKLGEHTYLYIYILVLAPMHESARATAQRLDQKKYILGLYGKCPNKPWWFGKSLNSMRVFPSTTTVYFCWITVDSMVYKRRIKAWLVVGW